MKGPAQSYCTMMDEAVLDEQAAIEAKGMSFPLRPSAAGDCARKLAYELNAYLGNQERKKETFKPSLLRLFRLGHHIEEQVINDLKKVKHFGVRFQQQVVDMFTLPSGRKVEGSTDCVLWGEETKALLDVKSVGDKFSSWRESRWSEMLYQYDRMASLERFDEGAWWAEDVEALLEELGEDTLVKNIIQLNLYACTDFLQSRGIDHVVVLRYQKNASKLMEIRFKPSLNLYNKTKLRFSAIDEAAHQGKPELVAKEFSLGSLACAYCPYQKDCWPQATKREHFANAPGKDWATKVGQLENAAAVAALFERYMATEGGMAERARLEAELLIQLDGHGVQRVKLEGGEVFEAVTLKSPKLHQELRRGKE